MVFYFMSMVSYSLLSVTVGQLLSVIVALVYFILLKRQTILVGLVLFGPATALESGR